MIKDQLEADLKKALLAGEKDKATTLRGLKSAILYEEVQQGVKDVGLSEDKLQAVLARESKKRTESIELYEQAGDSGRADAEKAEKAIIDAYLPQQLSEAEIKTVVDQKISELGATGMADMGKVIGAVKAQLGASADGAMVAKVVKEALI